MSKAKKWNYIMLICVLLIISAGWLFTSIRPYYESNQMINAIRNDDIEKLENMLQSGYNPNVPDSFYKGIWRYINTFCETSPSLPLSVACSYGNLQMVQLLLDYGADPALTEQDGLDWSAMSSAILASEDEDCVEIVKLLIANGADPKSDSDGYLPVFLASLEYIVSGEPESPERTAHAERIVALVALLIGDMDVNKMDGHTLLMCAALRGNQALVEYLLSTGADPYIQTSDGRTAYDFALMSGHHEVAEVLSQWMEADAA